MKKRHLLVLSTALAATALGATPALAGTGPTGQFQFTPLPNENACAPSSPATASAPFVLPPGYDQQVIASEPSYPDVPDMQTENETGKEAGRYLYRAHETGSNAGVSVTDLRTGTTTVLAQRADWERFDGIVWTPWGTLLTAEETSRAAARDPEVPQAHAGLVYELFPDPGDPSKLDTTKGGGDGIAPRPALGSKSHEGMRFDALGQLYSISETNPGYVYRFTPDRHGDLSSGQLSALKVTQPDGDRVGGAVWTPLDRQSVQVDATVAATAAGATGYNRPEDVEITTSTGNNGTGTGANTLYVSVTDPSTDNRVLGVDLREPSGGADHDTAYVYDYVRRGLNTDEQFEWPDNLALDHRGNLYIAEDKPNPSADGRGDDIWVATPPTGKPHQPAASVVRFASLKECEPEPTGIYFDKSGTTLYVDVQHRGAGDPNDETMAITAPKGNSGF